MPKGAKENRRHKEEEDAELAALALEAEPEGRYDAFHNDQPAFLLAKVDGDELAHLLESQHATPFDTPRMEDEVASAAPEEEEQEGPQPTHKVKRPETKVDGHLFVPGEADQNTEMNRLAMGGAAGDQQRSDTALTQAAHRSRVDAADASLEGEWQQRPEGQWSITHARILYTISLFACESPFAHDDVREPWLKELHLSILIYEQIQASLLPFGKSPQWMHAIDKWGHTQKIWLNMASEGVSFVNDLCKRSYLHVLRVITEDGWPEIAFRCTKLGQAWVESMPQKLKTQVDSVVKDPIDGRPYNVVIEGESVFLKSDAGFERESSITVIGRIPYVVSPYFATSVRHEDRLLPDNSSFAYECVLWESEVPDDRDEAVVLANVAVILAEWMFTGPNSIGLMVESLEGSPYSSALSVPITFTTAQVKGPIQTNLVKNIHDKNETKCCTTLMDFEPSVDLNFVGKILLPTDPPVKRVQEFGVHINQNGVVLVAVQIEALQDREWDDIAPQLLAAVLVELHKDSSVIVDPMLSKQQRDVLRCLYGGNHMSRTKGLIFIMDKIEPSLKAAEFMDGGRYQKEFVQLLGEVHTARDLTSDDIIFIGKEGILLSGPRSRDLEGLIVKYSSLLVIDQAIQRLYARIRTLNNMLLQCHHVILERRVQTTTRKDPREIINEAGSELNLLWTMMDAIFRSIRQFEPVDRPSELVQQRLWEMLEFATYKNEILHRSNDLERLITRTQNEVRSLTDIADIEDRIDLEEIFHHVDKTTQMLSMPVNATLNHTGEVHMRDEVPLRVVTCCLGAYLTFDILHRVHIGIETGAPTPLWFSSTFTGFNQVPALLLAFVIGIVGFGCYCTMWYHKRITHDSKHLLWRAITFNIPIKDLKKFTKHIHKAGCTVASHDAVKMETKASKIVTATFLDHNLLHWLGEYPTLTLQYDVENAFLISAKFAWKYWGKHISTADIRNYLLETLVNAGAIDMPDAKPGQKGKPAPSKKQQKAEKAKTEKKKSDKGKDKGNK